MPILVEKNRFKIKLMFKNNSIHLSSVPAWLICKSRSTCSAEISFSMKVVKYVPCKKKKKCEHYIFNKLILLVFCLLVKYFVKLIQNVE